MFLISIFFVLVAIIISDYFKKINIISKSKIKNYLPLPLPFIGNAINTLDLNTSNVLNFLKKMLDNEQKTFCFWNFNKFIVSSSNVKDMEIILSSQHLIQKNFSYDLLSKWFGNGVLISIGKKWHQRRKIITPTFHFTILEQFVEIFDNQSTIMVNHLMKYADGKTIVDIYPMVCRTALDIIMESAMGVSVRAQENPNFKYVIAVQEAAELLTFRARKPGMSNDLFFSLVFPSKNKTLVGHLNYMKSFTEGIIRQRREILEKELNDTQYDGKSGENNADTDDEFCTKKRAAFLDVLLKATIEGNPLSDEDIREEVETFMFAGHDTTTSGISFALYLIARHPEVQQKIFEEIIDVIGYDKQRPVTLRDLNELKYLDKVIKECLRMYPPAPSVGRLISEETKLNDIVLPAGTELTLSFYVMLHDPDNFPNPYTFDPERFSPDSSEQIDPFSYTPFSAGPRNCIGQKFAILEMKMTISKVLRYFELLPLGDEPKLYAAITIRSLNGVNLGLVERKY